MYLDPHFISIENDVTSTDDVYRCIDLLVFRDRKEGTWHASAQSIFEFHRLIEPLPEVVNHLLYSHNL